MNTIGYLTTASLMLGCAAYAAVASARRFERHFPAPANDVPGTSGGAAAARLPHGVSMLSTALRQGLPELPRRMRSLPIDSRGFPVPYFVQWIDGKPDFRVIDTRKVAACIYYKRCWICGDELGQYKAFVIGPLAAVNRTSSEPPSHTDCAKFAAQACPFLTRPNAARRSAGMPANAQEAPGIMSKHNPGVTLVWVTRSFQTMHTKTGVLFSMGDAEQTFWYAGGRLASRDQVRSSLESGLPELYDLAHAEGETAVLELDMMVARATRYFPAHAASAMMGPTA